MKAANCPGCGAKLQLFSPLTQLAVCAYCQSIVAVRGDALSVRGKQSGLAPAVSGLKIGQSGDLTDKRFHVLGRVRYKYSDGQWDEWYVRFNDGSELWLSEDEGEFTMEKSAEPTPEIAGLEKLQLGDEVRFGGWRGSVDEKDEAECTGFEGELPGEFAAGDQLLYAEGLGDQGRMFTLEQDEDGVHGFIGDRVPVHAVIETKNPYAP